MTYVTGLDNYNAAMYALNRLNLRYIAPWREKFPHIPIDFKIRWATNEDFYVPPKLRNKSAVVTDLLFSKEGCEAITCYPFTETGVIDSENTPIGGYTQTSYTAVQYNQPACFHMDRSRSLRDGEVQSPETRYANGRCIMVDTISKMYLNTPYLRSEEHIVAGVDDVPGFDVFMDDDPIFPDRARGRFNEAYCRRFGRYEQNNGCSRLWHEHIASFILGESLYTTFKLIDQNVFSDLRNFDYTHPSPLLPSKREPEGEAMLERWLGVRDSTVDEEREKALADGEFDMAPDTMLVYTANRGFSRVPAAEFGRLERDLVQKILDERMRVLNGRAAKNRTKRSLHRPDHPRVFNLTRDDNTGEISVNLELEHIISDFLEDHNFIMDILFNLGFEVLEEGVKRLIKSINMQLIPALRRAVLSGTRRFTTALLGNTYKAMTLQVLTRTLVNTVSAVARAMFRGVSMVFSIATVILSLLFIADFILMIWDPFGYSNMFPRGYLDDMSNSFLSGYLESLGVDSRELLELKPINFMNFIMDNLVLEDADTMLATDYLAALDVNSNGQLVDLNLGEAINDFDEDEVLGAALASYDSFAYFRWYCTRHDKLVARQPLARVGTAVGCAGLLVAAGAIVYFAAGHDRLKPNQRTVLATAFLLLVAISMVLILLPTFGYFFSLARHTTPAHLDTRPHRDIEEENEGDPF